MKKLIIIVFFLTLSLLLMSCNEFLSESEPTIFCPDECTAGNVYDNGWVPVWCDEFDGESIDAKKWTILNTSWGGGNNESQYYKSDNVYLEDGNLVLTAKKEMYGGKQYTSGRINSEYKEEILYGKIVIRANIPSGRGTSANLWLQSSLTNYGGWPDSGEIDIAQYLGYQEKTISSLIKTKKFNFFEGKEIKTSLDYEVENKFVEYSVEWSPSKIEMFVDNQTILSYSYNPSQNQDVPYYEVWPFDQKYFLNMNLAVGGDLGGIEGIDDSIFPISMYIDYVRVYKKDYKFLDKENPSAISDIKMANNFKNMIYWDVPNDDQGIEYYEIYLDNRKIDISAVNSYVFKNIEVSDSYEVKIIAVDFSGKKSEPYQVYITLN